MRHIDPNVWTKAGAALAACEVVTITANHDVQVTVFDEDGAVVTDDLFASEDPVETVKAVADWLAGYGEKPSPCADLLQLEMERDG